METRGDVDVPVDRPFTVDHVGVASGPSTVKALFYRNNRCLFLVNIYITRGMHNLSKLDSAFHKFEVSYDRLSRTNTLMASNVLRHPPLSPY